MALVLADRVKETTTTTGTGTVTLLGASTGFQSFAVIGNANTTFYTIAGQTSTEWEVGIGTYTSSGTTLARTTVLSNSSGTQPSALSFSAGTKDVFVTYPAGKSVNLDASNIAVIPTLNLTNALGAAYGGTGVLNNAAMTVTGSGNFAYTRTLTGTTNVTFPTTGTLATLAGSENLTNKTLTNQIVTDYVESVVAIGTVSSSSTLSLTNGTVQTATLTASTACTFTMPTATAGKSFVMLLKQAASTGNGTATFTGVKWGTAGAPTITATAGKMDILTFIADGTNWYGSIAQGYTP